MAGWDEPAHANAEARLSYDPWWQQASAAHIPTHGIFATLYEHMSGKHVDDIGLVLQLQ